MLEAAVPVTGGKMLAHNPVAKSALLMEYQALEIIDSGS